MTHNFYEIQLSVYINKVILEHGHIPLCVVFDCHIAELQKEVVAMETEWPAKPKMTTSWPFIGNVGPPLC